MKYTKKPDTLKMCLFILQYKNEALDLASFHKEVERGTKITLDFCFTLKTDKRREQKQHYALLRSQQLLRCFLDMRLVTVQPSKELQL